MAYVLTPQLVQNDLSEALRDEFSIAPELSVDCEMMGLNPDRDRLCVVQIASEQGACALVQIGDMEHAPNLQAVLENNKIIKIFHFARMDILFLFKRLNIDVKNIFCTKLASRLVRTYSDKHGLRELVREFIGENLDKSSQSSDWGNTNLNSDQINYAAKDVIFLFEIRRRLLKMMVRENRLDLYNHLIEFLPVQRKLDCLGYREIFEYKLSPHS